jgi:hypothetical protein
LKCAPNYSQSIGVYPLRRAVRNYFDIRKFAAEQKIPAEQALQVCLEQKETGFNEAGAEIYGKQAMMSR